MFKKVGCFTLLMFLFLSSGLNVYAADIPVVTYNGKSNRLIYGGDGENFADTFQGMMPGETRTQKILLINKGKNSVCYYFDINVLKEPEGIVVADDDNGAKYNITMKLDGNEILEGTFGGRDGKLKDLNGEDLSTYRKGDLFKLVDLDKGEQTELELTLQIDGHSMKNGYMNTNGQLEFIFAVEPVDQSGKKQEPYKPVNTGDRGIGLWIVLGCILSGLATIIIIKKKIN